MTKNPVGTKDLEVLECPQCNSHFSRDHLKDIEDEACPYCGFNYNEPDYPRRPK